MGFNISDEYTVVVNSTKVASEKTVEIAGLTKFTVKSEVDFKDIPSQYHEVVVAYMQQHC